MYAYKSHINITQDKKISIELPADMPEGDAELIVISSNPHTINRSESFDKWLNDLFDLLPAVEPGLSIDCSRETLYSDRI